MKKSDVKVGQRVVVKYTTDVDTSIVYAGRVGRVVEAEPSDYVGMYSAKVRFAPHLFEWLTAEQIEPLSADTGEFLVWSPTSTKAPTRVFTGKQARYTARKMAKEHGGTFYVAELTHKYTARTEVVKEEL